ncbi:MAG: response regulator transcription factor [Betaproteobacteria bacterium]|nr:response regulator transcription factor [Betaproteobacteria bacterium]
MTVTAIIAEDEQLFRDALVEMLRDEWPELTVIEACEDGGAALEAIGEHQPDFAFLDIRMPGLTGLEVAAAMAEASPKTQIVFVTAYNQYAIDAFDKGAVDYLLKPIVRERLVATIERLKSRMNTGNPDAEAMAALIRQLGISLPKKADYPPLVWLTASSGKETRLIMIDDVAYFQSDNKYTVVMTAQGESLVRTPLRELLDKLDPVHFKQIHRATIVNMKAISSITRDDTGRGIVKLKNRPETLTVSLTFMPVFKNM